MSRETVREQIQKRLDEQLQRQLEGPCPRCAWSKLIVFRSEPGEDRCRTYLARAELVADVDGLGPAPEETQTFERLIYCPNCGALHEVGGHTHYPQSGVVGLPSEVEGADVIPLNPIPWLRKPEHRCMACGKLTRDATAGCDHCDLEDQ